MLVIREVFQAKYGRGDELVALFREIILAWDQGQHRVQVFGRRILTDASGTFFTVVIETQVEDFAAWQQYTSEEFAMPEFNAWFARMIPLVESGRREFYTVVTGQEQPL